MSRRPAPSPVDAASHDPAATLDDDVLDAAHGSRPVLAPDLAALPIVGLTRRRMAAIVGVLLATWIVILFARQVGEASAATTRAAEVAQANVDKAAQIAALERELELIGRQRYITQQARGYGLGTPREVPFALAPDAPALPADAPGSATLRVGADLEQVAPLERWLTVLFGTAD